MMKPEIRRLFGFKSAEIALALVIGYGIASALTGKLKVAVAVALILFSGLAWFIASNKIQLLVKKDTIEKSAFASFIMLCLIYLAGIPKIAFLPLSPKYLLFLMTIFLLYIGQSKIDWKFIYRSGRPVWWYFILVLFVMIIKTNIEGAIPIFEGITLLFLTVVLVGARVERAVFLTRFMALFTLLSAVWFIGNILFYDIFLKLRQIMYGSFVNPNDPLTIMAMNRPTGLTFNHHIMGYHMAAAMVIVGLLALADKKRFYKNYWALLFPLVVIATILTAQRSVVPAVGAAFFIYFVLRDTKKIAYLVMAVILGFVLIENLTVEGFSYSEARTIQSRFESEEDIHSRLGWQVAALKIILDNPMGLIFSGKSWGSEAASYGADFSAFENESKAVHNSYLGIMMKYGWIGVLLVLAVLKFVIGRFITTLRYARFLNGGIYAEIIAFTLLSLLIQAMFHNAGILTNEPVSFMTMSLFLAWTNVIRSMRAHSTAKDCA